eukprot:3934088-Rhodomonas_salina.1
MTWVCVFFALALLQGVLCSLSHTVYNYGPAPQSNPFILTPVRNNHLLLVHPHELGLKFVQHFSTSAYVHVITDQVASFPHLRQYADNVSTQIPQQYFGDVVFLAAPTIENFMKLLESCLLLWEGNHFILASSLDLFEETSTVIHEDDRSKHPRDVATWNLLRAEKMVMERGGTVLRFGVIYSVGRDKASFFIEGLSLLDADRYIPMVSCFDAAHAISLALDSKCSKGAKFIICDGFRQTAKGVLRSIHCAGTYKFFTKKSAPASTEAQGNIYCNNKAKTLLRWKPFYASFRAFCARMHIYTASKFVCV